MPTQTRSLKSVGRYKCLVCNPKLTMIFHSIFEQFDNSQSQISKFEMEKSEFNVVYLVLYIKFKEVFR